MGEPSYKLLNSQEEQNSIIDSEVEETLGGGEFDELDRTIEKMEVEKAIRDVRLNAAPGQDMFLGRLTFAR